MLLCSTRESAAERKARIKREAADKLATSKLPRRLQMHEDAKRAAEAKAKKKEKKRARRKERQGIKAKPVPDFHAAHEKLDKQHKVRCTRRGMETKRPASHTVFLNATPTTTEGKARVQGDTAKALWFRYRREARGSPAACRGS